MKLVLLSLVVGGVAATIIGVEPDRQHLYEPYQSEGKNFWRCLGDPSIILNYDQINDNYCDCPDGSDEPSTNACPYSEGRPKFYCANEGFFPAYIDHSKLNDGICDYDACCDGSDEYLLGKCPNKCDQMNQQYVKFKSSEEDVFERAKIAKKELILESKRIRDELDELEKSLARDYRFKSQAAEVAKSLLEAVTVDNQSKAAEEFMGLLDSSFGPFSLQLELQLAIFKARQHSLQTMSTILKKLSQEYNPNFNDPAVKKAVQSYQNWASNNQETEGSESQTDGLLEALKSIQASIRLAVKEFDKKLKQHEEEEQLKPTFFNMVRYYYNKFIDAFLASMIEVLPREEVLVSPEKFEQLKARIPAAEEEARQVKQEWQRAHDSLNTQYGPDDIFRALADKVIANKVGEYVYKIGLFEAITQEGNGNNVIIGRFDHVKGNDFYFHNGDRCWNGPLRSAIVRLTCGADHHIQSVNEPEKCQYLIEISSPAACEDVLEGDILSRFSIDYDEL